MAESPSMHDPVALDIWRAVATGQSQPPTPDFDSAAFPTDAIRDEYLRRIDEWPEHEVRSILRAMFGESRDIPVLDELRLAILIQSRRGDAGVSTQESDIRHVADLAATRPEFTEYERRLILQRSGRRSTPTWEGLTWVLDLLPHAPLDAVNVVTAYITAHYSVASDRRLDALFDALAIIRNRYIGHTGATFTEQLELLLSLHWREFEYLCAAVYRSQGYRVRVTRPAKDRGRDVLATKSEPPERLLVQGKNWRNKIPVDVASALLGRVEKERATRGVLIGTSGFTTGPASTTELASDEARLELLGGRKLIELLNRHLGRDWPGRLDRIVTHERRQDAMSSPNARLRAK
jgi:restriction system protein